MRSMPRPEIPLSLASQIAVSAARAGTSRAIPATWVAIPRLDLGDDLSGISAVHRLDRESRNRLGRVDCAQRLPPRGRWWRIDEKEDRRPADVPASGEGASGRGRAVAAAAEQQCPDREERGGTDTISDYR
jgi:hypothetical protein